MSLRIKFLGLLVVIPSLCLALFLYFAISTFVSDKSTNLLENQFQLLNSANLYLKESLNDEIKFKEGIKNLSKQEGFDSLIVFDHKGDIKFANQNSEIGKNISNTLGGLIFSRLAAQTNDEGGFEERDERGEKKLVSFMKLPTFPNPTVLLLHVDKSGATRATLIFLLKSISTFIALISLAAIISLVFSNKLTSGIRSLSKSMLAFEKGDFNAPLPKLENDEVGQMAVQFGSMREQIQKLMLEQQEKAKIETEMRLAGSLQKRFFPNNEFKHPGLDLSAYFEPASDAGGDWWFYFLKNDLLIFVIGDVTGHGLNSAMITGVSRSAFSLIEQKFESVSESLRLLNKAIYDAAKGELMMTALVGCLNLKTGELTAANASHEVPFIIPAISGDLKKNQLKILDTDPGPRLGEKPDSTYSELKIHLEDDEFLILYSDGLTELKNSKGENFSERKLIKVIGTDHYKELTAEDVLTKIKTQALKHRLQTELADDLSFMIIKKNKLV